MVLNFNKGSLQYKVDIVMRSEIVGIKNRNPNNYKMFTDN